jgi:hypothetical protein
MHNVELEKIARQQIAERVTPPRAVPRQRRRTTIAERLRRTDTRPTN